MTTSRRHCPRWLLVVGLLLIGLALLLTLGQQQVLRPLLTEVVSRATGYTIRINELSWTGRQLTLAEVAVDRGATRLQIAHLSARWQWQQLLQGRLAALDIDGLRGDLSFAGPSEAPEESASRDVPTTAASPPRPQLPLDSLSLTHSQLRLLLGERVISLQELAARLQPPAAGGEWEVSWQLEPQRLKIHLNGRLRQTTPLALSLEQLQTGDRQWLQQPLQIDGGTLGGDRPLQLQLASLQLADLRPLAAALALPPWPEGVTAELDTPVLQWQPTASGWRGDLTAPRWQLAQDRRQLEGDVLTLTLVQTDNLQFHLKNRIKEFGLFSTSGFWDGQRVQGEAVLELDDLTGAQQWIPAPLPSLALPLRLRATGTGDAAAWSVQAELQEADTAAPLQAQATVRRTADHPLQLKLDSHLGTVPLLSANGTSDSTHFTLYPASRIQLARLVPLPAAVQTVHRLRGEGTAHWNDGRPLLKSHWQADRLGTPQATLTGLDATLNLKRDDSGSWHLPLATLQAQVAGRGARGQLALSVHGQLPDTGPQLTLKTLTLSDVEYASDDGLTAFGGGALRMHGTLHGGTDWRFDLQGDCALREVLHGAFYAETVATPLRWQARGALRPNTGRLQLAHWSAASPNLVSGQGTLTWGPRKRDLRGELAFPRLDGPAASYLRAWLSGTDPRWQTLTLAGPLATDLSWQQQAGQWALQAIIRPSGLNIKIPHLGVDLSGLDGTLPLQLGPSARAQDTTLQGQLQLTALHLGPVHLGEQAIQITSLPGEWRIPALEATLASGQVRLSDIEAHRRDGDAGLAANLLVDGVQLGPLTSELGWPPMEGQLRADLGRIHYDRDGLRTDGLALIEVFGGQIAIGSIRARDLLSPVPVIQGDVSLRGIDLARLTRTFSFGEMNGTLDGHIAALQLAGTVPSRFDARLLTRLEGERNISVKALNNLSVISQGGLASVLGRGVYQFINFYNYRRLGLACTLRNDTFRLVGTAREDSDRYLIDGGWLPPKIDIIAPPGSISFKEMLNRIKRVDRSQ